MDEKIATDIIFNNKTDIQPGRLETLQETKSSFIRMKNSVDLQETYSEEQIHSEDSEEIQSTLVENVEDDVMSNTNIFNIESTEESCDKKTSSKDDMKEAVVSIERSVEDLSSKPDYYPLADFLQEKGNECSFEHEIAEELTIGLENTEQKSDDEISILESQEKWLKQKSISMDTLKVDFKSKTSVLSGDFKGLRKTDDTWLLFGVTMPVQFEEEEEIKKEEQEDIADKTNYDIIDRKEYYEKFMNFQKVRTKLKVLNNLLQRKIALYYKKRLKSHVLKESASPSEWLNYVREYMFKLDTYEKLLNKSDQQHSTMELQIENLRIKKEIRRQQLEKMFDNMLNREIHIGIGLIYKKTGKEISDWLINQYISRQKTFMANLSELRAEHIKLKSMVVEKVQAIAKLDKVDNSHNLNRYIKLKEENRIYFDKHEEKEMELIKLREHSMKTLGCLAHIREKCAAVDNDNEDMNNQICKLEKISMDLRRKVSKSNLEKHKYRSLTTKLKEESGLLLEPNLLKDMERTQKLREALKSRLEDLKKEFDDTNKAIENIKKIIGTFDASKKSKVQSKHSTTKISQKSIKRKSTPTVFNTVPLDYGFFENCQPIIKKISIS